MIKNKKINKTIRKNKIFNIERSLLVPQKIRSFWSDENQNQKNNLKIKEQCHVKKIRFFYRGKTVYLKI